MLKKRVKRRDTVIERDIVVDEEGAKELNKLSITILETCAFDTPKFESVYINSKKRIFKQISKVSTAPIKLMQRETVRSKLKDIQTTETSIQLKHQQFKFSKLFDFRYVRTCSLKLMLVKIAEPPLKRAEVLLGKLQQAIKFKDVQLSPLSISHGRMSEEIVLKEVARAFELTKALFNRNFDELGLRAKYVGETIIVILPKEGKFDYHYVILEICKELYREARGGFPKPYFFTSIDQLRDFLSLGEKFHDKILVFELEIDRLEELRSYKYAFRELFSQGLGFLVFISQNPVKLREYIELFCKPYKPKIVDLSDLENKIDESHVDLFYRVVKLLWKGKPEDKPLLFLPDPSDVIAQAERDYRDAVDKLLQLGKYLYLVKRGENESEDHLALKILAIKHLVEVENVDAEKIETEKRLGERVIADLYAGTRGLVVEVETLYGSGSAPLLNLRDSALKYKDVPGINEIWVVLRNLPALLYLGDLWSLRNFLRKYGAVNVEFYVPNLREYKLVPLIEVLNSLKHLGKRFNITSAKSTRAPAS